MATISKRGPYQYQAIIRRKGYPSQTKTFETRLQADAWAREVETKIDNRSFRDPREIAKVSFGELLERYLNTVTLGKRSNSRERNRIRQIQRHPIALRSIDSLLTRDFALYRDERLEQVSATAVRLELALLSHVYTIAIKEWCLPLEHALKNVRKPPAAPGRERRLVDKEEERLFEAIQTLATPSTRLWLTACVRLAIETGMRAGEILTCAWSQVALHANCIRLSITKNGDKRTVPLSLAAVQIIESLPRTGPDLIGTFYDTSGLDRAFRLACDIAGITDLRFQDLRHECASRLAPTMHAQNLAKVMGWKTLQMAMRYYNPTDAELVALVRRGVRTSQADSTGLALAA